VFEGILQWTIWECTPQRSRSARRFVATVGICSATLV
jgi:hypothetical protein